MMLLIWKYTDSDIIAGGTTKQHRETERVTGDLAERIADGGLDSRVTVSADAHVTASIGSQFLQSVINIQQAGEIYEINSWIKENFRDSFTVEELAEKRNMSVSQFTRDYRKMFGLKPKEDMMKLRSQVERQSRG